MGKEKYYTFDPAIYPRLVWIAVGKDQFKDRFDDIEPMPYNANAQCDYAYDRTDEKGGVFVRFESIDEMTCKNITHEALHVAMMIYQYIECKADVNNQEHLCYLAGWIAECMEKVKEAEKSEKKDE